MILLGTTKIIYKLRKFNILHWTKQKKPYKLGRNGN
uniref:Uncharacterized protein n=1 Tax=Arundo donax TaxID=35708 RepID=A0A0A8ZG94_ARUDO